MNEKKEYTKILNKETENMQSANPGCIHFGTCGGCDLQNIENKDQIKAKKNLIIKIMQMHGIEEIEKFRNSEIIESEKEYEYRQRMDYVFAFGKAGLRKKGSYSDVIEINECPITPERAFNLFKKSRDLAIKENLESYDYIKHQGFLRYFVVRSTKKGETMLSIVTKTDEHEEKIMKIAEKIINEKAAESVHWLIQEGKADISFGKTHRHYGKEYIEEELLGKKFLIGPNTFFQSNPWTAEEAFRKIKDYIKKEKLEEGFDLYSGTATIATILSESAKKITSVDNNEDNTKLAEKNIALNNAKNVTFIEANSDEYLKTIEKEKDFVIVDPPRAGLGEKNSARILLAKPKSLIYMSCNPFSLAKDLKILEKQYEIKESYIVDMFPQTKHVETLVIMNKK